MTKLDWAKIAPFPSSLIAIGDVGEGKTALMTNYMDYCHKEKINVGLVADSKTVKLYPKWVKKINLKHVPTNILVAIDDAHLHDLYAHEPKPQQKVLDFIQRQKRRGWGTFYTTQDTTGFSLRLLRLIDCICVFRPNLMMEQYERKEFRALYAEAEKQLKDLPKGNVYIKARNWKTKDSFNEVYKFNMPKWFNTTISQSKMKQKNKNVGFLHEALRAIGSVKF